MVYGFVRQSNGHIRIDSAIGQGTSVKLYLPRTLDPVAEAPAEVDHAPAGRERVLVVEDNEEVRRAVVDMLTGWGYRVVAAENPDVAAAILERDSGFDLLFTDLVMPGSLSAIELAALAQRRRPQIAGVLTSGYARDLIPAEGRSDYPLIAKPYRGEADGAAAQRPGGTPAGTARAAPASHRKCPRRLGAAGRRGVSLAGRRRGRPAHVDHRTCSSSRLLLRGRGWHRRAGAGVAGAGRLVRSPGDRLGSAGNKRGGTGQPGPPAVSRLPVVIASGYGRSGVQGEGLQFISKPYSAVDLNRCSTHAARGGLRRDLARQMQPRPV
jgi:CheY-like chemotaxis protein